jgi:hypothetical protein
MLTESSLSFFLSLSDRSNPARRFQKASTRNSDLPISAGFYDALIDLQTSQVRDYRQESLIAITAFGQLRRGF